MLFLNYDMNKDSFKKELETATYCSLSVSTLRRAVQRGTLKASRRTGKLLFHRKDIDRYLTG